MATKIKSQDHARFHLLTKSFRRDSKAGWLLTGVLVLSATMLLSIGSLRALSYLEQQQAQTLHSIDALIQSIERLADPEIQPGLSAQARSEAKSAVYQTINTQVESLSGQSAAVNVDSFFVAGLAFWFGDHALFNGVFEFNQAMAFDMLTNTINVYQNNPTAANYDQLLSSAVAYRAINLQGSEYLNALSQIIPKRLFLLFLVLFGGIVLLVGKLWFQYIKPELQTKYAHKYAQDGQVINQVASYNKHSKELDYIANFDPLTGLKNRQFFTKKLNALIDNGQKSGSHFALVMLNVNRFKMVNDSYGLDVGDHLLKDISRALLQLFPNDSVMRLNGDEFAVLVIGMQKAKLTLLLDQLVKQTFEPSYHQRNLIQCNLSVGVAFYPQDARSQSGLVRRADIALNAARTYRRDLKHYCFFADLGFSQHRLKLPRYQEFLNAVTDGQLTVYYSPQFSLHSRKIIGTEALIRWEHPEHGKINVEEVIKTAEQYGLLNKITELVLNDVALLAEEIERLQLPSIHIGVNFSGGSKEIEDAVQSTLKILDRWPALASSLVIEVTERVIFGARGFGLSERLEPLRQRGVKISLDDFGTGYASLTHLTEIAFDVLKIDRSFVLDMQHSKTSEEIIKSMVSLSHALDKEVIAEGIETEQQLEKLASMGCDAGQGYYISRPVPRQQFIKLLHRLRPLALASNG